MCSVNAVYSVRLNRRLIAYTAAAMYGGGVLVDGIEALLPGGPSIALAVYRVVQEGLINALRHARASRVDIAVRCDARRILATVTDDGVGLPADWTRPGHFGLRGLAERVRQLGGTFDISDHEGRGVRLCADIPLRSAA